MPPHQRLEHFEYDDFIFGETDSSSGKLNSIATYPSSFSFQAGPKKDVLNFQDFVIDAYVI